MSGTRIDPAALDQARRAFILKTGMGLGWLTLAELFGTPALAQQYLNRTVPYTALIRCLDAGKGPRGLASVVCVRASIFIPRLECDRTVLMEGAHRGFAAVMSAFDGQ